MNTELFEGIDWVGYVDWTVRNFHGYRTERGSSYNAYLVRDEKTALIDTVISELPPFLTTEPGLNSGYMLAHVTAAALASENKQLSHPASVDSMPTSANQEDHVSMATHGARRLIQMNANTRTITAIELMAAVDGIDFHRPLKTSPVLEDVHSLVRERVARRTVDREFSTDIAAADALIASGKLSDYVKSLIAPRL